MSTLKVKSASVLIGFGTDKISLHLEATSPFPAMGYEATATIEATKGCGYTWVKENLGIDPKIIDTQPNERLKFSKG